MPELQGVDEVAITDITLKEKDSGYPPMEVPYTMEADLNGASVTILDDDGYHVAEVFVELYAGRVYCRVWGEGEMDGDPTAKVLMFIPKGGS
jgi:hypothetical protein